MSGPTNATSLPLLALVSSFSWRVNRKLLLSDLLYPLHFTKQAPALSCCLPLPSPLCCKAASPRKSSCKSSQQHLSSPLPHSEAWGRPGSCCDDMGTSRCYPRLSQGNCIRPAPPHLPGSCQVVTSILRTPFVQEKQLSLPQVPAETPSRPTPPVAFSCPTFPGSPI